ncbi:hypothetical protein MNV49_004592 [Pseudohyphozyma bogoriensis]|nr:hypothetical protein MNV49_004592 [Pseudohyphozyma bogoriensis]
MPSKSTTRRRQRSLSIAPATTPDLHSSSDPATFHSDLTAALAKTRTIDSTSSKDDESPTADRRATNERDEPINVGMVCWGYGLLGFSVTAFVVGMWSIAIGPFVDTTGVPVLNALAKDTHYKYLLVFFVPVTLYAVIINWWGLKIFRHA